jgi:hypothetical protein
MALYSPFLRLVTVAYGLIVSRIVLRILVQFHLRQFPGQGQIDTAEKTKPYEHPDPRYDAGWECSTQDIGIESLPNFMAMLWHTAGEVSEANRPWYSKWRRRGQQQTVTGQVAQSSRLPLHEFQSHQDQETRRWQDYVLSIRIYVSGAVLRSSYKEMTLTPRH